MLVSAQVDQHQRLELVLSVTSLTGLMLVVLAVFDLAFLENILSIPILMGIKSGCSILMILGASKGSLHTMHHRLCVVTTFDASPLAVQAC